MEQGEGQSSPQVEKRRLAIAPYMITRWKIQVRVPPGWENGAIAHWKSSPHADSKGVKLLVNALHVAEGKLAKLLVTQSASSEGTGVKQPVKLTTWWKKGNEATGQALCMQVKEREWRYWSSTLHVGEGKGLTKATKPVRHGWEGWGMWRPWSGREGGNMCVGGGRYMWVGRRGEIWMRGGWHVWWEGETGYGWEVP